MFDPDEFVDGPESVWGLVLVHDKADNAAQVSAARLLVREVESQAGDRFYHLRFSARRHRVLVHHIVPRGVTVDRSALAGSATVYVTDENVVHLVNRGWKRIIDRGADRAIIIYDSAAISEDALGIGFEAMSHQLMVEFPWGLCVTALAARILGWLDESLPLGSATAEHEAAAEQVA